MAYDSRLSYTNIDYDINDRAVQGGFWVKQGDTGRGIKLTLWDDGKIYDKSNSSIVNLNCKKPDGKMVWVKGDFYENSFYFKISSQMSKAHGDMISEFEVITNSSIQKSETFIIEVKRAILNNASEPEITPSEYEQLMFMMTDKVNASTGKGLSEEDFTTEYKIKMDSIPNNINSLLDEKVSKAEFDMIGRVDLEVWARHYINSPMLVKNPDDPAYLAVNRNGVSYGNMSQVLGGMFNNAIPELQRVMGGIDTPATAWALLNMVKLYKLTGKSVYLNYVNLIASYFKRITFDSTYYGANIKVVPNVMNYNFDSGNWEASKNFYHLRTPYHVAWAMLEAFEVTGDVTYKNLAGQLLDTSNVYSYSVNSRSGTEIATYMHGAQYNTIHSSNGGASYAPEWTSFNNTTLDVIWEACTKWSELVDDNPRPNAVGIMYTPTIMRDEYAAHLKYMYDNKGLRRANGHKMLYCFTKFNWADPTTNGLYEPTPMNWDFIEDVWGVDQWFTGDLEYWAINGFIKAGYTSIGQSLMNQYYTLRLQNRGNEILFYDRYDKDGNPLPDDQSVSIVFTGLFMSTMNSLGVTEYNKDSVETIRKYQIKSANVVIDGGFHWDVIYNNSYLESKSLGEIIHSPIESVVLNFTLDGIFNDTQILVSDLSNRLTIAEGKINQLMTLL